MTARGGIGSINEGSCPSLVLPMRSDLQSVGQRLILRCEAIVGAFDAKSVCRGRG